MGTEEKPKVIPEGVIETEQAVLKKGKLGLSWKHPTSLKVRIVCETVVYTNAGVSALVSGSDLFTGYQSKAICFVLGVMALVAGGVMKATGVKPAEES